MACARCSISLINRVQDSYLNCPACRRPRQSSGYWKTCSPEHYRQLRVDQLQAARSRFWEKIPAALRPDVARDYQYVSRAQRRQPTQNQFLGVRAGANVLRRPVVLTDRPGGKSAQYEFDSAFIQSLKRALTPVLGCGRATRRGAERPCLPLSSPALWQTPPRR